MYRPRKVFYMSPEILQSLMDDDEPEVVQPPPPAPEEQASDEDHIRSIEDMVDATPDTPAPPQPYIGRYPVPKNFNHFKPLTLREAINAITAGEGLHPKPKPKRRS